MLGDNNPMVINSKCKTMKAIKIDLNFIKGETSRLVKPTRFFDSNDLHQPHLE